MIFKKYPIQILVENAPKQNLIPQPGWYVQKSVPDQY
jgi:hypothetical protein